MLQKVFAAKILGSTAADAMAGGMHRLDSKTSMASSSCIVDGGGKQQNEIDDSSSEMEKKVSVDGGSSEEGGSSSSLEKIGNSPPRDYSIFLKYMGLLVLILQNAALVLVTRYATTRHQTPFLKTVAVFYNEVIKIIVAIILFFITAGLSKKGLREFRNKFSLMDTLKLGVPALAYTIQTSLLYVAIENLDAATFMVTYQLKILTTAFFTVIILKRRLSIWQWLSLLILVAGVATVQFSADQNQKAASPKPANSTSNKVESFLAQKSLNSTNATIEVLLANSNLTIGPNLTIAANSTNSPPSPLKSHQNLLVGVLSVLAVCSLSGFAGVYIEKILKKDKTVSIWMQNIQLGMMAIPFSLLVIALYDGRKAIEGGFMQGFDLYVWIIVLLQSIGGIATAVVIKYADNILKSFAVAFGIILVTIAAIFLFSVYPKLLFILGATLVSAAVAIYGLFPYKNKQTHPTSAIGDLTRRDLAGKGVKFVVDEKNGEGMR